MGSGSGVGVTAAITLASAAELLTRIARGAKDTWPGAAATAGQADALRERARRLAGENAAAHARALLAIAPGGSAPGMPPAQEALLIAAAVPLDIAEIGADLAQLAADAAGVLPPRTAPDAAGVAQLAAGATSAAAHLVAVNLAIASDDHFVLAAERAVADANAAAERAAEAIQPLV